MLISYLALLAIVDTIFVIVQARTVQVIYVENRNYPGGPWAYFLDTQYLAINVMFYASLFVITVMCDLLVVRHLPSPQKSSNFVSNDIFSSGAVGSSGRHRVALWPMLSLHYPVSCSSHPLVGSILYFQSK